MQTCLIDYFDVKGPLGMKDLPGSEVFYIDLFLLHAREDFMFFTSFTSAKRSCVVLAQIHSRLAIVKM